MKKLIFRLLIVLSLSISFAAQMQADAPLIVDEFGVLSMDEKMARLDALLQELRNNPEKKAHIRIFGGTADYFARPYVEGSLIDSYIKNNRKISPEKYSIEYCNVNKEELRVRLYLIPQGSLFPKCDENLELPTKTILFERSYFYFPNFKFIPMEDEEFIDLGPSQGSYSRVAQTKLKKLLDDSPASKLYIIAYLQAGFQENENGKIIKKKADKPSLAKKLLQTAKNELIKNNFKTSQLELINGGYASDDGERKLEFWFVPKNGEIPKPKPDYSPKKKTK